MCTHWLQSDWLCCSRFWRRREYCPQNTILWEDIVISWKETMPVHSVAAWPVLLSRVAIPVTEDSQTSLVAKKTMQEDSLQCQTVCHVKAPGFKRPPCWWDRIESWLAAPVVFAPMYQYGHCKTRRCCWTHLTVCWTPIAACWTQTPTRHQWQQ